MTVINTKVTGSFPHIAQFDIDTGNITGLTLLSNIEANLSNGNITGSFVVSSNISNVQTSTVIGNGDIRTGGIVSANAFLVGNQIANSTLIISNVTPTGLSQPNWGGFTVTSNANNPPSTTTIGDGSIWTGTRIYNTFGYSDVGRIYQQSGLIIGANSAPGAEMTFNGIEGSYVGTSYQKNGTEVWYAGIDNGHPVTNANGAFVISTPQTVGTITANVPFSIMPDRYVAGGFQPSEVRLARGIAGGPQSYDFSPFTDELLKVGANTSANTIPIPPNPPIYPATNVFIGINSSNSVYSGIRISRENTQRWLIAADNTNGAGSGSGNLVMYSGAGLSPTRYMVMGGGYIRTYNTGKYIFARKSNVNISSGTNYRILFENIDTSTINGLSYANGVWTNTSSIAALQEERSFLVNLQVAFAARGSGFTECDIWFQLNSSAIGNDPNRRGQIAYVGSASPRQLLSTSFVVSLARNEYFSCYAWANDNWTIGSAQFGIQNNYSATVKITELI